jgi:hypothetical protein
MPSLQMLARLEWCLPRPLKCRLENTIRHVGFGCPELCSFSFSKLVSLRLPFGMSIERDILFQGAYPLSVYQDAACQAG